MNGKPATSDSEEGSDRTAVPTLSYVRAAVSPQRQAISWTATPGGGRLVAPMVTRAASVVLAAVVGVVALGLWGFVITLGVSGGVDALAAVILTLAVGATLAGVMAWMINGTRRGGRAVVRRTRVDLECRGAFFRFRWYSPRELVAGAAVKRDLGERALCVVTTDGFAWRVGVSRDPEELERVAERLAAALAAPPDAGGGLPRPRVILRPRREGYVTAHRIATGVFVVLMLAPVLWPTRQSWDLNGPLKDLHMAIVLAYFPVAWFLAKRVQASSVLRVHRMGLFVLGAGKKRWSRWPRADIVAVDVVGRWPGRRRACVRYASGERGEVARDCTRGEARTIAADVRAALGLPPDKSPAPLREPPPIRAA